MKCIRDASKTLPQSVVTIGNFDGVHLGHQTLINQVLLDSCAMQVPSVLLTFSPHPTELFAPDKAAARLMRFSEKWKTLLSYGLDYFYCARFNKSFASLSPDAFVKNILVDQLRAKKVIVGDDFQFGAKRAGTVETLKNLGKKYGFVVEAKPQYFVGDARVSSTRVRDALRAGNFKEVIALTGRPYALTGRVAYGNQIGRTLGFPTANIHLRRKVVPLMGIFVVAVNGLANKALPAVASVGYRPTFNGKEIILEVFIFDFDQVIYGKAITVTFLEKIRDELKFDSIEALVVRMNEDVTIARQYFR